MPGFMDTLNTLNNVVRTFLATVVLGALGIGGYVGYTTYNAKELESQQKAKELKAAQGELTRVQSELASASAEVARQGEELQAKNEQIASLNLDLEEKERQIVKLDTSLRLLKVDHRLARITCVNQGKDTATGETYSEIEFQEIDDHGQPLDQPRQFRIRGDVVYVNNWIVKFDDRYVEEADIDRATSLCLFRRIFGDGQRPLDGFPLDETGARPTAYARGGKMSDFERKIWDDFWNIANDDAKAKSLGIRAAHGDAVSIKAQKGKSYKLQLRASDGLSLVPEEKPDKPAPPRPRAE